jgi:hypothetical protein
MTTGLREAGTRARNVVRGSPKSVPPQLPNTEALQLPESSKVPRNRPVAASSTVLPIVALSGLPRLAEVMTTS